MTKYFCDCCGKEIKGNNLEFKVEVGHFYASKEDICDECRKKIEKDVKEVLKKHNFKEE